MCDVWQHDDDDDDDNDETIIISFLYIHTVNKKLIRRNEGARFCASWSRAYRGEM